VFLRKFPDGAHQGSENNNLTLHMKTSIQSIYSSLLNQFARIACTGALLLSSSLFGQIQRLEPTNPVVVNPVAPAPLFPTGPRPTLVVLVHGRTARPADEQTPVDPVARPGTLGYSRFYFDFPFVSAVLGNSGDLFTKGGLPLQQLSWKSGAVSDANLDNCYAFADRPPARGLFRGTAVGLVRHDGSVGIGLQARSVLSRIDELYQDFRSYCGVDPQLVIIAHSKGGLVSRYILSVPTGSVAGVDLTANEEATARHLRDKTKFLITLGTPHNGSPIADHATAIREGVETIQGPIDTIWGIIRTAASIGGISLQQSSPLQISSVLRDLAGSPDDLGHLTSSFCRDMNVGPLHPSRMARTDGSLIPVYTYGGRSPGDAFYATPNHSGTSGFTNNTPEIVKNTVHGLIALDYALHNAIQSDWGSLTSVGAGKSLDLTRRTFSVLEVRGTGPFGLIPTLVKSFSAPGAAYQMPASNFGLEGLPIYYARNQADGETDNDGMVAISSALGINLGTGTREFFDHTQNIAPAGQARRPGSWYRMYSGAWNFLNHSTETKSATMGVELRRVLVGAGPNPSFTGNLSVR